jgi:hypothetical protein
MQKKVFFGMAAVFLAVMMAACPTTSDGGGETGPSDSATIPPEKPRITGSQTGFELIDAVNLKTVTVTEANTVTNQSAVVSFVWEGEGARSYNVYWSEENLKPDTPNATGLTAQSHFARNLEPETEYYFWVESVNPIGTTLSDPLTKTTGKPGPQASGGLERGDYPRNMQVIPGNGSLTVSWSLSDRVGWYEVYYAPVETINHLDIYTPKVFKWQSGATGGPVDAIDVSSDANASSIAYKAEVNSQDTGYTRPVYPFLTPLADGWIGYQVKNGLSTVNTNDSGRPILGTSTIGDGVFHRIMEASLDDLKDPYKPLDAAFASAIPWNGSSAGAVGTPVKFFGTSTTITGLTNGTEYEVWIRTPNANGERGYGYAVGTPGGSTLAAVSGVQVAAPEGTSRDLQVTWSPVDGATQYRIYASTFDYEPFLTAKYDLAAGDATSFTVQALKSNTSYYVWVVAEKSGVAGKFGSPSVGKTGVPPATGHIGDKVITGTSAKVKTAVYIEVNDDNPLNASSYILEDGTYLFDYVILFAANIRNRTPCDDGCTETGVHVHLNPNVRRILTDRNKYIKPLQDKGIKVLLGLLGDHDGIGFGTMTDPQRTTFMANLKSKVDSYGLDGVDFDDEWASKEDWDGWGNGAKVDAPGKTYNTISPNSIWTYPTSTWSWPTTTIVYRDPSKGIVAGNGIFTAPSETQMDTMWKESGESFFKTITAARTALGITKTIALYEYNTGRYITPSGADNGTAKKADLQNAVDFALQPWYNRYIDDSINGIARAKYSPFGMDLSGEAYSAQNGAPNPPIVVNGNDRATNTIYDYATRFKNAATSEQPYNMLYFYALEESTALLKRASADSTATVTKEAYLSMMTEIVFGQKTVLTAEGGDYRKDW